MAITLVISGAAAPSLGITLDQPRIVIGRGPHADVRLPSRTVSDLHAVIRTEGAELFLLDEGSTNGTRVNGQSVPRGRKKALKHGDVLGVAGYELRVELTTAIPDPPERTGTLARRLLLGALAATGGEASPPTLTVLGGRKGDVTRALPPAPSRLVLGRAEDCDLVLDDRDCSRHHAEVARDADGSVVRDLGSKNGVVLGGRRHTERRLRHGDEFTVGRTVVRYLDPLEDLLRSFEGGADEPSALTSSPGATASGGGATASPLASGGAVSEVTATRSQDPARSGEGALPAGTEVVSPTAPTSRVPPARVASGRAVDWVVVALAVVILAVSVAALFMVLNGAPRR